MSEFLRLDFQSANSLTHESPTIPSSPLQFFEFGRSRSSQCPDIVKPTGRRLVAQCRHTSERSIQKRGLLRELVRKAPKSQDPKAMILLEVANMVRKTGGFTSETSIRRT